MSASDGFVRVRREALLIDPVLVPHVARALDLLQHDRRRNGLPPLEGLARLADEAAAIAADDEIRRTCSAAVPTVAGAGSDPVEWFTVTGTAEILGVSESYVRRLARSGALRGSGGGPGTRWQIDAATVAAYAERRRRRRR